MLFLSTHFDEAVIEGEVVSDAVLPALFVLVVVREALHDELVDAVEGDLLVRCCLDSHRDEGDVTVRRLLWLLPSFQVQESESTGSPGVVGMCRG